jgi:hypothetical protein
LLPDARDWSSASRLLSDGSVEVSWLPDREHPLELTAAYCFAAPNLLDFRVTVRPHRELRQFELFLAWYFAGFPASFVYADQGPKRIAKAGFMEARREAGDWQMFPRDDAAVRMIGDGRWNCPPNPVTWAMRPRLAAPLALRRDADRDLAAVVMAPRDDCFAVSMPFDTDDHRSVYLSLFGCDLKAGERKSARARTVIGKGISDQQAIGLFEEYQRNRK